MELTLQNVGIISKATIKLNGLTVICGSNNSGKSTAGKALYSTIEALSNLEEKWHNDLSTNYRNVLFKVSRLLDLDSISRYIDFNKMQEYYQKDFSMLLQTGFRYHRFVDPTNVVMAFSNLKDVVEFLTPHLLLDFVKSPKNSLPKKFFAFLDNFEENREKTLSFIDSFEKYFHDNPQNFAEKSVAALFYTEFNGQVFPINLKTKEKTSNVSISKNGEIGCNFSILKSEKANASISHNKLFFNNAIYVDDPYILDKFSRDDEFYFMHQMPNRLDYSHTAKLIKILLKRQTKSLIEQSINYDRYDSIVSKIDNIIPGTLTVRDSGLYYEETGKEPLKVQNLATGSKMFSIIKNLLEKGEINFDTMLILDEPESHLHPEWQNVLAEVIVMLVKELDANILLTTHSPNFLMALEAYSKKYDLCEKTNYYMAKHKNDNYMVDYICVNDNLSDIYSSFALPLVKVKSLKDN